MTYKDLTRRTRAARQRSDAACLKLYQASQTKVLTDIDKAVLRKLRRTAEQAIQACTRMNRRLAKVTRAATIPSLVRSTFKKATMFKRTARESGFDAALAQILRRAAGTGT